MQGKDAQPMTFRSVNRPNDFEFHDVVLSLIRFEGDTLILSARYLNIHKGTEQNASDADLEIESAICTFMGFQVHTYEVIRPLTQDANGVWHQDKPFPRLEGKAAADKLIEALKNSLSVHYFERTAESLYYMEGDMEGGGTDSFFTATFSIARFVVEWENYRQKAWYESFKGQMGG